MKHQGKNKKQMDDSLKIIFWSAVTCFGVLLACAICNFIF